MALVDTNPGHPSACPACIMVPSAERIAAMALPAPAQLMLSLPGAHCAACISTVEAALHSHPGVHSARVNLTLKRVSVAAAPQVTAAELALALQAVGFEAHELDPACCPRPRPTGRAASC